MKNLFLSLLGFFFFVAASFGADRTVDVQPPAKFSCGMEVGKKEVRYEVNGREVSGKLTGVWSCFVTDFEGQLLRFHVVVNDNTVVRWQDGVFQVTDGYRTAKLEVWQKFFKSKVVVPWPINRSESD